MYQRVLGIDTAGTTLAVGLFIDGEPAADVTILEPFQHSRLLLPVIKHVLTEARCPLSTVDLIGISQGPGSYTGLRLGAMAAKVLGWSIGAPVMGVDSLAVIAGNVNFPVVVASLPARRGEVYARAYNTRNGRSPDGTVTSLHIPEPITELLEGPVQGVLEALSSVVAGGSAVFVGDGLRQFPAEITRIIGAQAILAEPARDQPRGSMVARLARELAMTGDPVDPIAFVPLYSGAKVVKG